jgi:hypothetical protein
VNKSFAAILQEIVEAPGTDEGHEKLEAVADTDTAETRMDAKPTVAVLR